MKKEHKIIKCKLFDQIKNSKAAMLIGLLSLVVFVLIVCFVVYSSACEDILPNVKVMGLNVGGMDTIAAESELTSEFEEVSRGRSVVVECEGNKKTVKFDDLKVVIDAQKTAENAFAVGRSGGLFAKTAKLFMLAFSGENIPLEVKMDESVVEGIIKELANNLEVLPVPTGYRIEEDELVVIKGHGGKMVNRKKTIDMLSTAALDPSVKNIVLKIETLEEEKVDIDKFYDEICAPMKNATYSLEDGDVVVIPEKIGVIVDKMLVESAIESREKECYIPIKTEMPQVTATQLREQLFRDVISSYSSNFATSTAARASNVILTAERINGAVLMPGDVFSYDSKIGRRTAENGYREAGVYVGNKVESGIGGGICQTSSTLYSAALYANLEIVSRTSHSLPVSYVPAGQDATIAEGYIDLKIKNNYDFPVKIVANVKGRTLTCSILGVKNPMLKVEISHTRTATYEPGTERVINPDIPKGYVYVSEKGAIGYAVSSQRIVRESGKITKTENLTKSIYRAAPRIEEVNADDKDTPIESLKPYTPGMIIEDDAIQTSAKTEDNNNENTEVLQPETQTEDVSDENN
jgi:vancomycin resistance protein YoaR